MKKFLTIVFFYLPAFGQAAYSGPGLDSGPAAYGASVSGGGPLTYSARTDNCVTGAESGCLGGKTTGEAGSAMSFLGRVTDTVPSGFAETPISSGSCPNSVTPTNYTGAYCTAPMNSTAADPDFGTYMVMASDDALGSDANSWDVSWTSGSSGGTPRFTTDEILLLLTGSNGDSTLVNVNPSSIHAKTCATSPCASKTGIYATGGPTHGNSTHFAVGASLSASLELSEPSTYLEADNFLVNKLAVSCPTPPCITHPNTSTMVRTKYADFVNGTGSYGGVFPPITVGSNTSNYQINWSGLFIPSNNDVVGFAVGGGYDWLPSWTPADVVGNTIFIDPLVGNNGHAFQATTISGTTGTSEPTWSSCTTTCTDGGVTWTNIGSINGQGPGFDIVHFSPSLGYSRMNTRLGKIYRGSGNSAPAGLLTTNDPVACTRVLGAPCGTGVAVNLPDEFTIHDASQDRNDAYFTISATGAESTNPPGSWNSGTLTCQNSGGSFVWAGAWASGTTYTNKQTVSYTDLSGSPTTAYYAATSHASNLNQAPSTGGVVNTTYWTQQEAYCPFYYWSVATTLVQPTTAWQASSGHAGGGVLYAYHGGKYAASAWAQPSAQLSPPNGAITLNPGTNLLATGLPCDDHPTYQQADALDHQPPFSATGDLPSNSSRYTAACYNEICAFNNVVTGAPPLTYRFAHNFNTGCGGGLGPLGTISPLGDLFMFGSDWLGTRNVQNNQASGGGVVASSLCEATKAVGSMTLTLGENIFPISSNAGNWVYQVTVAGTASSSATPTGGWCQTLNCTATWGTGTVEAIGQNNGRSDVVIADLLSAHAAP